MDGNYENVVQFKLTKKQAEIVKPIFDLIIERNKQGERGLSLGTIKDDGETVRFFYVPEYAAVEIREILFPNYEARKQELKS